MFSTGYFKRSSTSSNTLVSDVTALKASLQTLQQQVYDVDTTVHGTPGGDGGLQTFVGNVWTNVQNNTHLINDTNVNLNNLYRSVELMATELPLTPQDGVNVFHVKREGVFSCNPRDDGLYPGCMYGYVSDPNGLGVVTVTNKVPYFGQTIGRTLWVDASVRSGIILNHGTKPMYMVWNRTEKLEYIVPNSNPTQYVSHPVGLGIAIPIMPGTITHFAVLSTGMVLFQKMEYTHWPGITQTPAIGFDNRSDV